MSDDEIDFRDIPQTTEADWSDAVRGPILPLQQRTMTLALDAEAYEWLLTHAKEDASGLNFIIRREAQRERRSKAVKAARSYELAS